MYYTTNYASPLGRILLAGDGKNIVGLWLEGQKYYGDTLKDKKHGEKAEAAEAVQKDDLPVFAAAKDWLGRYFRGDKPGIAELPLSPAGSEFRKMVWDILCKIPYGEYITYGDIAAAVSAKTGRQMSAQAVGGAVGHNPISIIIPCHRVVGTGGSLTGYAGGIGKKVKLLEHEGADMSGLFVPAWGTAL
ncbi:MAG: methylated-DNA--[protein]-cysteine S-methyltransferase [Clostridiales Family XIII bacterium]|jgi:methylated-DNA-[protein]-cysteine S-methyltransferase|nr:methylated-DNA--[protein]-cysteine S-methyltransferase [Clostridiales Family XIII bacterium]